MYGQRISRHRALDIERSGKWIPSRCSPHAFRVRASRVHRPCLHRVAGIHMNHRRGRVGKVVFKSRRLERVRFRADRALRRLPVRFPLQFNLLVDHRCRAFDAVPIQPACKPDRFLGTCLDDSLNLAVLKSALEGIVSQLPAQLPSAQLKLQPVEIVFFEVLQIRNPLAHGRRVRLREPDRTKQDWQYVPGHDNQLTPLQLLALCQKHHVRRRPHRRVPPRERQRARLLIDAERSDRIRPLVA